LVDFLAANNFGDTRTGGLAGPMGLFIIVLLSIATVLLIRNMNKHLRRLPDSFENVDGSRAESSVADPTAVESAAGHSVDRQSSTQADVESQVSDVKAAEAGPSGDAEADR
jgi:hypothetical protein